MALAECFAPQTRPGAEAPYPPAPPSSRRQPRAQVACPLPAPAAWAPPPERDYSIPLHVDCSVEYELPDCAKPPQGVKIEPLLMIHPAHFRRLDSLRRCPFVNNLPAASGGGVPFELPPPPSASARRPSCRQPRAARGWSEACRLSGARAPLAACAAPDPAPDPFATPAPKEGDTLDNSAFPSLGAPAKCPSRPRTSRHRTHPYAPDPNTSIAQNCDKTFDALQGNPLISPFHAKMFSSESVYQNYPIAMYK